jgi:hypothetical protein
LRGSSEAGCGAPGFCEAWGVLEHRWAATVERARLLPADLLHESVDGEWSFTETLRHLAFASDAWVGRVILGDPSPWHPLDLPWDEMRDTPGIPRDRDARPSLDTVLELRHDRMATVRRVIEGLTDVSLDGSTEPVEGQAREQARLIRSGTAGELTEADVEHMAAGIAAAGRARLDAAVPDWQGPSVEPELQATRRGAARLMAVTAREVNAESRKAWRTRQENAGGRWWRKPLAAAVGATSGSAGPGGVRGSARRSGSA